MWKTRRTGREERPEVEYISSSILEPCHVLDTREAFNVVAVEPIVASQRAGERIRRRSPPWLSSKLLQLSNESAESMHGVDSFSVRR